MADFAAFFAAATLRRGGTGACGRARGDAEILTAKTGVLNHRPAKQRERSTEQLDVDDGRPGPPRPCPYRRTKRRPDAHGEDMARTMSTRRSAAATNRTAAPTRGRAAGARRRAGGIAGVALTLAACTLGGPTAAWAQTDLAIKEAEARFKEGLRRHDAGDEDAARLSFLEAYSVLKRPNILFNLARAEQLTGHPVEAIQHYKIFVAENSVTPADRELARKRIDELTPLVAHLAIVAPLGSDVWIDGQLLPRKAPLSEPADVSGGMHTVQARLGDQTKTVTAACSSGQTTTVKIEIELPATPLVVVPIPGEPGTQPGGGPGTAPPAVTYHYETPGAKIAVLIGLGAAAVGLVAGGIGLEIASNSAASSASTERTMLQGGTMSTSVCFMSTSSACQKLANDSSSSASDSNTATALFVGAGVAAAAYVTTLFVWPKTKVEDRPRVTGLFAPGVAGLGLQGSF